MDKLEITKFEQIKEFENLYLYSDLTKELTKILSGWGNRNKFEQWLYARLAQLNSFTEDCNILCQSYPKFYENLHEDGLFAITYRKSTKNIRLLFSLAKVDNSTKIILCAFDEKNTTSDYNHAKKIAKKRLKDFGEENNNE